MIRIALLLLHILPLTFLTTVTDYKKEDLKIEISAPQTGEKGSVIQVELKFTRGPVKGFAKYTESLPLGVTAKAVDLGDATFTFDNQLMKIIWLNLPNDDEFTIKYELEIGTDAPNTLDLGGKFSYLDNNDKQVYHPVKRTVTLGSADELAAAAEEEARKNEIVSAMATTGREIIESNGDKHTIEVTINKQGIDGFSKVEEFVPFGGKVEEIESENAVFSFIKNKAKFVWMSVPEDETFKIRYSLDLSKASNKDPQTLKGTFSYLDNNNSKKVDINFGAPSEMLAEENGNEAKESVPEEPTAQNTEAKVTPANAEPTKVTEPKVEAEKELAVVTVPPITSGEEKDNDQPNDEPEIEEEIESQDEPEVEEIPETEETAEPEPNEVEERIEPKTEIADQEKVIEEEQEALAQKEEVKPKPQVTAPTKVQSIPSGVNYRVQIAAGKNVVDAAYFEKRHQWTNEFVIENHEGWVKYTTGSFQQYKMARDSREEINANDHKFDGPFVTAYNEGSRITVQEALMITKQKWFK